MIFIFPTELEAAPFREACPSALIVVCGVGLAECAACVARLVVEEKPELLILCGIAGSYDLDDVALGEVVELTEERIAALPERFAKSYFVPSRFGLREVSSNSVNVAGESHNMQVENMEGAAFMSVCQAFGVECAEVRAVSNLVGDPFERWSLGEALDNLCCELQRIFELGVATSVQ